MDGVIAGAFISGEWLGVVGTVTVVVVVVVVGIGGLVTIIQNSMYIDDCGSAVSTRRWCELGTSAIAMGGYSFLESKVSGQIGIRFKSSMHHSIK